MADGRCEDAERRMREALAAAREKSEEWRIEEGRKADAFVVDVPAQSIEIGSEDLLRAALAEFRRIGVRGTYRAVKR